MGKKIVVTTSLNIYVLFSNIHMKNLKVDRDFEPNFSGFFVWLLLANDWASDKNIFAAYTRGSYDDFQYFQSIFKKIAHEHISEIHC